MESGLPALLLPTQVSLSQGTEAALLALGDLTSSLGVSCGCTTPCMMNELPALLDYRP